MDTSIFKEWAEWISLIVDGTGVLVIVVGIAWGLWGFATGRTSVDPDDGRCSRYRRLRQDMGRGILLGLELMVAGDIIRTVAVEPTLEQLGVLAGIVAVRTFLSLSLEVELEGRWPWHSARRGLQEQPPTARRNPPPAA